jgi:hypothetical protein
MLAPTVRRLAPALITGFFLVFSAGCDRPGPAAKVPPAAPSEPTSQDFGEFQLHFNAIRTDQLTAEVARAYAIERSTRRVMLNVALLRKDADGRTVPVDGTVTARVYNLNGQLKDMTMRRIAEGESVDFIGETGISGNEILVFNIQASPLGQSEKFQAQFKREFYAD